jgi:hypothetical protein
MSNTIVGGPLKTVPLADLLERVGVSKSSIIRVTGPSSFSALLWFCRHGYDQVGYVRPGEGCPHEEPDAIIVAHTCNELDLKRLLSVGRQVRADGVFIFQFRSAGDASPLGLEWLLDQSGFTIDQRLDRGRRALIVARRRAIAFRKAA